MDQTTVNQLISAGAGLVGAMIGASASFLSQARQHQRQVAAERANEARERERQAAKACDRLFRQLAEDVPANRMNATVDRSNRIYAALDELDTLAVDLPQPLQGRIAERTEWMRFADELGSDALDSSAHHYLTVGPIAREIEADAHRALTAFLRNEKRLPETSDLAVELAAAYKADMAKREHEYAPEIAQDESARTRWLESHPEVRAELQKRVRRRRA